MKWLIVDGFLFVSWRFTTWIGLFLLQRDGVCVGASFGIELKSKTRLLLE